ncbi:MAG: hypothetical protein LC099_00765 [Anaerolineales bacterium]|nr:hypothetical protein [Anaerolineales bacterium]
MPPKKLTFPHIYGSDPLAKLVFLRLNLSPIGAGLFFLLATLLYAGIIPYLEGYSLSFEQDGANLLLGHLLVYPVAGYFYVYQPKSILSVYRNIAQFLREEDAEDDFRAEKIIHTHAKKSWWLIGVIFGLLGAAFGVAYSAQHFKQFWYSANWFEIVLVFSVRFVAYYCIAVSAARHIAASVEMNRLFKRADLPLAADADQLAVFRSIKNFALEFIGVAAIIALNLGLQPLFNPPVVEYFFYVALYLIVAPISFFLPIWGAHARMMEIKEEMLTRLNYDFQEESQKLYRKFRKNETLTDYLEEARTLNQLSEAIKTVSDAPDWPFQGTTFYRMAVTIISPFFIVLFEIFVNVAGNIITN